MLLVADVRYVPTTTVDTVLGAMDTAINPLLANPVDKQLLDRSRVKARSSLYDTMTQFGGFGLMDLLSSFALFDDDPARVNSIVPQFDQVTPELILKTAQEYLRPANRTVVIVQPAPKNAAAAPAKNQ
jgi:predicted Zn-dependent peptidase